VKNLQFLAHKLPYLRNGARQDQSYYGGLICMTLHMRFRLVWK